MKTPSCRCSGFGAAPPRSRPPGSAPAAMPHRNHPPGKQQQAVAGSRVIGACQRRMLVVAPRMQAQQNRPVRIADLAEIIVRRFARGQPQKRLVPRETAPHVTGSDDGPYTFHAMAPVIGKLPDRPRHADTICRRSRRRDDQKHDIRVRVVDETMRRVGRHMQSLAGPNVTCSSSNSIVAVPDNT